MSDRLNIFIIDDDLDDQVLMRQAFDAADPGVYTRFATRSDEALSFLSQAGNEQRPHMIVSDYNMPMMNGEEFLQRLATAGGYDDIPKVIVSTAASPPVVAACMRHGASDYFIKPSDFTELVRLAEKIITIARRGK